MKKSQHNSSTSLFLMEMILALLFLSLCSAACIQIFAAARKNRIQAEQWNQIQALTTSVGEALEGSNGSPKQLLALLPDGTQTDNSLIWYYDHSWQNCSRDEADYEMVFVLSTTSSEKSGELSFRNIPENTLLYQITLNFPDCGNGKEENPLKQKHTFFVTVGIPSLFLIFSVLCLCVLALLTLSSSRTSLTTARHSMEQTEKYYSACSEATERVADIRSTLAGYLASAEDKAEYFSQVKTFADTQQDLVWNSSDHTLSFSTKFADSQQLSVILEIFYPGKTETSVLKILQWSTESNGTWNPDNHQNLFKGE